MSIESLQAQCYDYYYISSGSKNCLYTLRHAFQTPVWSHDRYVLDDRDHYVCTLANDSDRAIEKARDLGYNVQTSHMTDLNEIRRRNAEQMAEAKEREAREQIEREAQEAVRKQENINDINRGVWPFGKYQGQAFADATTNYIKWIAGCTDTELDTLLSEALKATFPNLFPKDADIHYGTKGEKYTEEVVCSDI